MATISAVELHNKAGEILTRIRLMGERFVVEWRGRPVAALIGFEEYQAILPILEDLEDVRRAEESLARYRANPEEFVDLDAYLAEKAAQGV